MREIMEIILDITERKRMLVSLPFGLAKLQALFLQFAPGALKLTPDQVELLRRDNVVSDAAKAAGLTLEGARHRAGFAGSDRAAISLALPPRRPISAQERVITVPDACGARKRCAGDPGSDRQTRNVGPVSAERGRSLHRRPMSPYFPIASAIRPSVPTMTRHQANSAKPWRVT